MNILLFNCGPISFEPKGIFGISFQQTSPENKCDQQTKNKKVPKELLYIPFKDETDMDCKYLYAIEGNNSWTFVEINRLKM